MVCWVLLFCHYYASKISTEQYSLVKYFQLWPMRWQHFEKKITCEVRWSQHRFQCCFHVLDVFNKYITWQIYKTSNISDVRCITFIKCWFKTQAGISQAFSTIPAYPIWLHDITVCGITISISQYHNIKAICSLFDLCHVIESSASPSCLLHFQFHLITGSAKHKIIKTVTKPIGRIGDLSVNI